MAMLISAGVESMSAIASELFVTKMAPGVLQPAPRAASGTSSMDLAFMVIPPLL
jgi:hypothetical protein